MLPIRDQAAALFYTRLFELDLALRQLFNGNMEEQGGKLMQMPNTVVQKLGRLNELLPQVRELAQRHVEYDVKDSDYNTVSSALMWTLGIGLGDAFTLDLSEAWAATYMALSDAMRRDVKDSLH